MWKRNERRKEKEDGKRNWFHPDKYDSVMSIAATPRSELRNKLQEEINKKGCKTKVIEKSGYKIVRIFQQNDPFKSKVCS